MNIAFAEFSDNHRICKSMTGICQATEKSLGSKAADEVSRAQVAFLVSALDRYVHERVRLGMLDIFLGRRPETHHYGKFTASLSVVNAALASGNSVVWLDSHIRNVHSFKSFQKHDKVADALRLITAVNLWSEVATRMNARQSDVTTRIDLIVDWRNRIVHEFDTDPSLPNQRFSIARSDVQSTIGFLARVIQHVDRVIR